jgi:hypothetical protein
MSGNEGYLEVGCNDQFEIIVNHPDLKPDADGVGHIVFSPDQARHLAHLLLKHAAQAELDKHRSVGVSRRKAAEAIPVDRSARTLSDGSPETPDHREINPDTGQQKGYVVLSAEERAKGFVRPVRRSYVHVGIRPQYPLSDINDGERAGGVLQDHVKFEEYPESESPKTGRYWTRAMLNSGCGATTTMTLSIAETFARDPQFYGGGFCCICRDHFPVEEFVWEGTDERVGS